MKNIVKDIKENCPDCECDTKKTVEFLVNRGDISFTRDHYREVWFFYSELQKSIKNRKAAREATIEMFRISPEKFKVIRKWWNSNNR